MKSSEVEMTVSAPMAELVQLSGPAGVLEAVLEMPRTEAVRSVAVVCHPHPQHGGTMNNKVVHALTRACHDAGAATLRFNYRGVGHSAGGYDEGVGETDDALAAVAWMQARFPGLPLWLAGFSFGGGVALRAALRVTTDRLITVSPAAARQAVPQALPTCPWLLLQGDADEVIPAPMVLAWVEGLSIKPQVQILEGASHFFHGRLIELRERVRDWLLQ